MRNTFFKICLCLMIFTASNAYARVDTTSSDSRLISGRFMIGFAVSAGISDFSLKLADDFENMVFTDPIQMPPYIPVSSFSHATIQSVVVIPGAAMGIGLTAKYKIDQVFDLVFAPELTFASRKINYQYTVYDIPQISYFLEGSSTISSSCLELPIKFRYNILKRESFQLYTETGLGYVIDFSSEHKNFDKDDFTPRLEKYCLNGEFGAGAEFKGKNLKYGFGIRYTHGFKNLLIEENTIYTSGIESLKTRAFLVVFTIQ